MTITINTDELTRYQLAELYAMLIKIDRADDARAVNVQGARNFGSDEFGKELTEVLYNR